MYIDGANMLYSQNKMGWHIDWKKMKEYLTERYDTKELRYYTGVREDDEKMIGFLKWLEYTGYTTVVKPLKRIKIGSEHPLYRISQYREIHKSNVDVEMATDILISFLEGPDNPENIKHIILMSGDGDFAYLIKELKRFEIQTVVIASKSAFGYELKLHAKEIIFLEDLQEKIEK